MAPRLSTRLAAGAGVTAGSLITGEPAPPGLDSLLVAESISRRSSSRSTGRLRQEAPVHSFHRELLTGWPADAVGHSAERLHPPPSDTIMSRLSVLTGPH